MEQKGSMETLLSVLMSARSVAHVHHWRTRSFSRHVALGELYEALNDIMDQLAEMHMGAHGTVGDISLAPVGFSEADPIIFIGELHQALAALEKQIPQDGFLVNKFQELQGTVAQLKYKLEQLA